MEFMIGFIQFDMGLVGALWIGLIEWIIFTTGWGNRANDHEEPLIVLERYPIVILSEVHNAYKQGCQVGLKALRVDLKLILKLSLKVFKNFFVYE
ncbi:MAG: hypothetical protein CMF60_07845 [Magnetococcales bacterium]|nr:hypothetical protein [Magnetococcales bacterium]